MSKVSLRLTSPDGKTESLELDQQKFILGAGESADVKLSGEGVDDSHVLVKFNAKSGKYSVLDMGSEAGFTINGEKTTKADLNDGDVIGVGGWKVHFSGNGASAAADAPEKSAGKAQEKTAEEAPEKKAEEPPAKAESKAGEKSAVKPEEKSVAKTNNKKSGADAGKKGKDNGKQADAAPKNGGKSKSARKEPDFLNDIVDIRVRERHEMPEKWLGKPPPAPKVGEANLPAVSDSNKALEVAQLWHGGPVDVGYFSKGQKVRAGTTKSSSFTIPPGILGEGDHIILDSDGSRHSFVIPDKAKGLTITKDGSSKTITGQKSYALDIGETGVLDFGDGLAFRAAYRAPGPVIGYGRRNDPDYWLGLISSTLLHGAALLLILVVFYEAPKDDEGSKEAENPWAQLALVEEKQKEKKEEKKLSGVEEGAKAKDKEGEFGKKDKPKEQKAPSKDGAPNKDENRRIVMQSGILGALNAPGGGASASVFGPGGLGGGINDALGGLYGTSMGTAGGLGGLGSRGSGPGGGGTGVFGLGGRGSGRGAGGSGGINLGGTGKGMEQVDASRVVMKGGLDKSVIAAVIKRHWNQIKYCYEKELSKNPDMGGKVTTFFIIGPNGTVQTASIAQSDLNNAATESCMVSQIQRWVFPKPKGGGNVQVTYPFVFQATK
ncbi:MAG: hypothetical protein GMKNLPBB_01808 [Myxococcota bacterium]|nr:hypothetical protein [Myxococcota bacterium]